MSNKSNIFSVLPQDHSEDEDNQGGQHSRKDKKPSNKRDTGKVEEKSTQVQKTQDAGQKAGKDEHKKKKQVPEPGQHPLDRHSGTGQPAYDRKTLKKGGHGKGNVGGASNKEGEEETKEEATEEEQPAEEAKPEGITLEEYYAQSSHSQQSQVDQAKAKTVQDELTKELLSKKATLYVKNKGTEEEKHIKKVAKANVDHHAALNSEHADLLNFRTGFVEREFRERKEGEKFEKYSKPAPKKEEKTEEAQPAEEKAEEKAEGEEGEKADDKERKGGKGGYRGGNRGGYKGNKGGNRGGNYSSNKGAQPKINVEDDSAFPKLG